MPYLGECFAVFHTIAIGVDLVDLAVDGHFGASPYEGGGQLEDEFDGVVALSVDVAPHAVALDGHEAFGAFVGGFVLDGDDDAAAGVGITVASLFLDEEESFGVEIFHGAVAAVVVFDGEDGVAFAVDDAVFVAYPHPGVAVEEAADLVVPTAALFALEVHKGGLVVAHHHVEAVGVVGDFLIDEGRELLEMLVEEGGIGSGGVDCPEGAVVHGGELDVFEGDVLFALMVDHGEAVVFLGDGIALLEGVGEFELGLDDHVVVVVDVAVGQVVAVEVETDHRQPFAETGCRAVLEVHPLSAGGVEKAIQVVLQYAHHAVGGVVDGGELHGQDEPTVAMEQATFVVVAVDDAVVAMEFVDEFVFGFADEAAVVALEAEEAVALDGLDAVDVHQLATARFVVDNDGFRLWGLGVGSLREGGGCGRQTQDEG